VVDHSLLNELANLVALLSVYRLLCRDR